MKFDPSSPAERIFGMDPNSGISGMLRAKPDSGRALSQLAQTILRGATGSLSAYERELVATYVSFKNGCYYCTMSHRAAAAHLDEGGYQKVDQALIHPEQLSLRLQALLAIADHARVSVDPLPKILQGNAAAAGADETQIHDTVLIAAAFSMFNRYVETLNPFHFDEGLGFSRAVTQTKGLAFDTFDMMGQRLARSGYS